MIVRMGNSSALAALVRSPRQQSLPESHKVAYFEFWRLRAQLRRQWREKGLTSKSSWTELGPNASAQSHRPRIPRHRPSRVSIIWWARVQVEPRVFRTGTPPTGRSSGLVRRFTKTVTGSCALGTCCTLYLWSTRHLPTVLGQQQVGKPA